ncbi:hypothetical protein GN244_ATG09683 [Phytophthora infestans]|uniref:Uncharacterized protein n=1 Tax=Phytophthora infestans TaxID=4787 RepID=A0A833W1C3_PHYIN|nr:hypothetical protein GN244_ATG09683 [Phytophthora infestans]KAF4136350.1 hypothetical protein GN958_ATG14522 [Phytophthora infestans]
MLLLAHFNQDLAHSSEFSRLAKIHRLKATLISLGHLIDWLATTISAATATQATYMETQREARQVLRQSMKNLQQMAASAIDLFTEMKQPIRRNSS